MLLLGDAPSISATPSSSIFVDAGESVRWCWCLLLGVVLLLSDDDHVDASFPITAADPTGPSSANSTPSIVRLVLLAGGGPQTIFSFPGDVEGIDEYAVAGARLGDTLL